MTERQKRIWDLLEGYESLTSGQIAELLHISDRTVRSDIKEINTELGDMGIQSRKGQGYSRRTKLPGEHQEMTEPFEEEQDISWEIVRRVLFEQEMDYLELADKLYISDSSLTKLVNQLNRDMMHRWKTGVVRKLNGELVLEITEEEKRQYYANYVILKNLRNYFSLEYYQPYFKFAEISKIKKWVIDGYHLGDYRFYDATLVRIIVGTAVMLERILAGFILPDSTNSENTNEPIAADTLSIAMQHVLEQMEVILKQPLTVKEMDYLRDLFRNDFYCVREETLSIEDTLNQILIEIHVEYGFDFTKDEECFLELKAQLNGILNRTKYRQHVINPVLLRIKSQYPLEYDIGIFFADRFKRLTGGDISEDEIGMITVHFIRAMETNLEKTESKVALINPFGKQIKELMAKRLTEAGECKLSIAHTYSVFDYPKTMPKDIIAVLTTVSLPVMPYDIPVILCKNFLDYREKEKLLTVVRENQVSRVKTYFRTLFKPALFFTDMEFESKEDALRFMSGRLASEGYVEQDFYEKVIQREHIAPTAFEPGFAFAHGMENTAMSTAICICVLKNKMAWGDYDVRIIFLFALASTWNHTIIPIYNVMIDNLFKANMIKRLSKSQDLLAFLDLLI